MYAYENFRSEVKKAVEKASGRKCPDGMISKTPDPKFGDLSCSIAFSIAKEKKKKPNDVAADIARKIKSGGLIGKAASTGPYVNFHVNWGKFNRLVLDESVKKNYGSNNVGKGKTVMVEYSAPNPNKPQHVGHLRNNLLGMATANCLAANGFKVVTANWINDRGIHICKSMLAYEKWGKGKKPDVKSDHFVGKFYTEFVQKEKENPKLTEEAQEMLRKWEANDKKTRELWKKVVDWAYEGYNQTYKTLGSEFDIWFYESQVYERGREIVHDALKKKLFEWDKKGAVIAPLEEKYGLPNKVMIRGDGTTIYSTADLGLNEAKNKKYKLDKSIFCVASAHDLYFQQLFKIFELLGYPWAKINYHLSYGMMHLPEGKMSSREGRIVNADELIDEMVALAKKAAKEKGKAKDVEKTAKIVGIGALKFGILKTGYNKDIVFDREKTVSFEGDTGPYLQYAHARCCRILEKAKNVGKGDYQKLVKDEEKALIKKLGEFPDMVKVAGLGYEFHTLANYLLDLAHTFSAFYLACPVLSAEGKELINARLKLVKGVKNTLDIGLNLLGIEAPEMM